MPDDRQFLAAARLAVALVGMLGGLPGKSDAQTTAIVTFLLLDFLKSERSG